MLNRWRLLSAVCALALTGCAAPQGQYQAPLRSVVEPLPPELRPKEKDRQ
ncbi:hypothetical protein ABIB42_003951 [Massilia sp. UYP32]|jgi:hypothetical protein|uniref:Uncharacterized protein n=1 Tax=Massilia timonae CCUG 45783 TaxID=883126 RepID=K9DTW8_9BURK|nr:hypothetical protein [Massilia timonae]EKU82167.1 hypothetical protein HMPREF9710_02478 [Massilia timonae CCUG 45783]